MVFGAVEFLATIFIVIGILKLLFFLVAPNALLEHAKRFYANPRVVSFFAFILAAIVLYFLVSAGVTIVQIFAIGVFIGLLLIMKLAPYAQDMLKKMKPQALLKEHWFYMIIWVLLMAWGIKELFF